MAKPNRLRKLNKWRAERYYPQNTSSITTMVWQRMRQKWFRKGVSTLAVTYARSLALFYYRVSDYSMSAKRMRVTTGYRLPVRELTDDLAHSDRKGSTANIKILVASNLIGELALREYQKIKIKKWDKTIF